METFVNSIDAVKHSKGVVGEHLKLGKYMLNLNGCKTTTNATLIANMVTCSTEAYLTYAFLAGANCLKYDKIFEDLLDTYA
eukprot:2905334-Ditylum_brightwellii.AAC.1